MDYEIGEIISYDLEYGGLLVVSFRLKHDEFGTCRYIETDTIRDWAEENDIDRNYWVVQHNEEEDYYDNDFNFDFWLEDNNYPEIVAEFISDRFHENDLPLPDKCC
jgi:hypothetical protein